MMSLLIALDDLVLRDETDLLDLPLELLTAVCQQLDLRALVRMAAVCRHFRHGDGGLETLELPTKSPVVTALRALAFSHPKLVPSTRPIGCSESWVAYLARCARQRVCREAPPIAAGDGHTLFVEAAGRLLACGEGVATGHGGEEVSSPLPTPVAAMAGIRVRCVVAALKSYHSLALGLDGRVYSWGENVNGQLGHGDKLAKPSPTLVEGLECVRGVAAAIGHSHAVTQSGAVFSWGTALLSGTERTLRPIIVKGFGGVRVRRVCAGDAEAFAISEAGELFSWGFGHHGCLGHSDEQDQPHPKRVEALEGVEMSNVSVGISHALASAEDGRVYTWGDVLRRAISGNLHVERELLPKPVEALQGVRVSNVAAAGWRSWAVTDTGELWAWGFGKYKPPIGCFGQALDSPLPKPFEPLRGIKVDAVAAGSFHTLALADDGNVYAWGTWCVPDMGARSPDPSARVMWHRLSTPQRIPALRVACGP
jgi:alpha-tubulin suppressor-like RCC1 family protein